MRRSKKINDSVACFESSQTESNRVKDVKVLGIYSKNGRIYPLDVMRQSLHLYENCKVNLDHKPEMTRSVLDVFGKIEDVYMGEDGIYGTLCYNIDHPYAPAFEYFVKHQPEAIGLSHAAMAKTRMNRDNIEEVLSIEEVSSVDLVATAATNKNLFESYTQILESITMNDKKQNLKGAPAPAQVTVEADSAHLPVSHVEALPDDKNLPHVSREALSDDKDLPHVSKLEAIKAKKYETVESYNADLKEALEALMGSDLATEAKVEAIMGLCAKTEMCHDKDDVKKEGMGAVMGLDETDDKKKAEESLKKVPSVGYKLLLEELETYRLKDAHATAIGKAKAFCVNAGLNEKHITESFIDVLCSVSESKWSSLVADRKSIASSAKAPISISADVASGHKGLTVDELLKRLRS